MKPSKQIAEAILDYTLYMDISKQHVIKKTGVQVWYSYEGHIVFEGSKETTEISRDLTGKLFHGRQIYGVELFMKKFHTNGCPCSFIFRYPWE